MKRGFRVGGSAGRTNERKKDVGVTKSRMDGFGPGALLAPRLRQTHEQRTRVAACSERTLGKPLEIAFDCRSSTLSEIGIPATLNKKRQPQAKVRMMGRFLSDGSGEIWQKIEMECRSE